MENTNALWKWIAATVLVVILGLGIGYYASTPNSPSSGSATDSAATDASAPVAPDGAPAARPPLPVGQYLAKGAPEIQIKEEAPDPNKKAVTTPTTTATASTKVAPSPATTVAPPTSLPVEAPPSTAPSVPDATVPAPPPVTPPHPADSSASLPTTAPASATPPSATPDGPLYHVLVGTTFSSEKNARIFAADLRHRGFMAMTASVSSDSGVVYKVQVGAYRNRLSAEEAANQLQQSGYPAYIATDR
ncbi:MAG TPA: SPOR domain-containing protein [Capsulimonadaceae bacterium]